MVAVKNLEIFVVSSMGLFVLSILIYFLRSAWWNPIQIQKLMRSQGIQGPSFRFLHGNTKEILNLQKEMMRRPKDLSHQIFPRLQPHVYHWINTYGEKFLYWNGTKANLVITEPELIKEVLNNKDKYYAKADTNKFSSKLLGDGLLTTEGEKWVYQRKIANHTFHGDSLKSMIPAMIDSVEMMLKEWKQHDGQEIEVSEQFRQLTSEIISRTAFGSSYLEGKDMFKMLVQLSLIIARNSYTVTLPGLSLFMKTDDEIEAEKLEQGIHNSILRIIKKREKASSGEVDNSVTDFIGLLVRANQDADEGNRITIEDVIDECKTFYMAGHETTASLLTWTVLLLASNTDWQEKAHREVLTIFGQQNPNSEGIAKLKTMSMIINESLRLYPPVVTILRKVKQQVRLGKFILPANINIAMPTYALHRDNQIWGEDAHQFKPGRFSEGVAKANNNNPAAFLPFGLGPRTCVGLNFAMYEAKIALSMILQRYTFTLSPAYVHSPIQIITVGPQHGLQVILHPF